MFRSPLVAVNSLIREYSLVAASLREIMTQAVLVSASKNSMKVSDGRDRLFIRDFSLEILYRDFKSRD